MHQGPCKSKKVFHPDLLLSPGGEQQVYQVCRGLFPAIRVWRCSKCCADQVCPPGCQQESDKNHLWKKEKRGGKTGKVKGEKANFWLLWGDRTYSMLFHGAAGRNKLFDLFETKEFAAPEGQTCTKYCTWAWNLYVQIWQTSQYFFSGTIIIIIMVLFSKPTFLYFFILYKIKNRHRFCILFETLHYFTICIWLVSMFSWE